MASSLSRHKLATVLKTGKNFTGLIQAFSADPKIVEIIDDAKIGAAKLNLGCHSAARPLLAAAIAQQTSRTQLVVTSTFSQAEQLTTQLASIIGEQNVAYYPAWETLPHERLSPRTDTVGQRLEVLRRLAGNDEQPAPKIVVAAVRALLQPQIKGLNKLQPVKIKVGQNYPLEKLTTDLAAASYARVDLVERRGEFAIRGGIADIFPPTSTHPVRIDFFGDEVDTITYFTIADQRSGDEMVNEIIAAPCRELLITDEVKQRAAQLIDAHPEIADLLEKISQGIVTEGMEALMPALADGLELLVDCLPKQSIVVISEPELVKTRAAELVKTSEEFLAAGWAAAASGGKAPIDLASSGYRDLTDVEDHAAKNGLAWWQLTNLAGEQMLNIEPVNSWHGDVAQAVEAIANDLHNGLRTVFSVEGKGLGSRIAELLGDHDIASRQVDELVDLPEKNIVTIFCSELVYGFRAPSAGLALHAHGDLNDSRTNVRSRKMPARRKKNQVVPLELKAGDPLVHEQHGVGRFVELVQREAGGAVREYLVIEYAPAKRGQPADQVFVPMDQLDQITRYVGAENPKLDKMGGADWKARKAKAKKAVKAIAADLIKLYAARQATKGHAFAHDSVWQRELEDAFSYTETPDQLAAIEDVKADMERVVPMERLISGDVGYGKTEIAVRAAFKAVQDNKQVALLVPTTLLVQQHNQTFTSRYAGFPVTVAPLSRFQSEAETKKTIEGIAAGTVDVVIGTHRLLSDKIKFKDLGLVIIDEEQRFGVEHKEALKKLRLNVDVLSMSATPIPRTLEMAITGIREMSTIATPPEERHPVLTFAGSYDEGQVGAAIRRELAREGQCFYVHNRVQDIDKVAAKIAALVPQARVVVAHGQMSERELEQVMLDFWQRKADVLVATTIVEAGLDISTANTLIVDRADHMGLSQLHQLRGRVGRGRDRGYAYFLYPNDKPLTEMAYERLNALTNHNDLGAGQAIAMKDLEIRGAGNLLGQQQSGHIADVGFDLYLRLVGEAVADYKAEGQPEQETITRIELPVEAHLPVDYVESERLRLEIYQRIAGAKTSDDVDNMAAELIDRFGPIPLAVDNLLNVARFRIAASQAGINEIVAQGKYIRVAPVNQRLLADGRKVDLPESRQLRLSRLYPGSVLKPQTNVALIPAPKTDGIPSQSIIDRPLLDWATALISNIFTISPKL